MRNVLYWSPNLRTDANGKAQFKFYTLGSTGNYFAVVQELMSRAGPGAQVFPITVK
jgi:hypothetical protein